MRKFIVFTALTCLVAIAAACGNTEGKLPGAGSTKYTFTADEGGTITKIDLNRNNVVDKIKVGGSVHNVQVSPDGKLLGATLVPNSGHGEGHGEGHGAGHEGGKGVALFFDTATDELVKQVEVGKHPAHIVFTSDQRYALVTNNEDNNVSVIDVHSFEIVNTLPTGNGPHGFRISSDGRTAYVANMGEDTVSVLDLAEMKELRRIKVGSTPVTTAVTRDGKQLLVTLHTEDALAVVDLATDKVEKVSVGKGPAQVYLQADDLVAVVANQGNEDMPSNTITKVDLKSKKAIATIETGKGAHGVVTSPDNKWIYVTNMFENTVSVVDNSANKEVAELKVGQTPNGISLTP